MRGLIVAAVALMLAGCSEVAGVTANAALKSHQVGSATEAEQAIAARFAAEPALAGLKASVAMANHWRDGFQTRVSVLLAGTAADEAASARAAQIIRETIGGAADAIAILDRSRLRAAAATAKGN